MIGVRMVSAALAGVVVGGLAAAPPATAVEAHTAVVLDSDPGDPVGDGSALVLRTPDATVTGSASATTLSMTAVTDSATWTAVVQARSGETLATGRHETRHAATGDHAGLAVSGPGGGCTTSVGEIEVHELTFVDDALATFAATFRQVCDGATGGLHGELRYASPRGYKALGRVQTGVPTGVVGRPTSVTVTVTNTGVEPVTLSPPTVGDGAFALASDGCAGALAVGASCPVSLTFTATGPGEHTALLSLHADTPRQQHRATVRADGTRGFVYYSASSPLGINRVPAEGGPAELVVPGRGYYLASPAISPDGTRVLYARGGVLWITELATGASRQFLPGDEGDGEPVWSRDGTKVAFIRAYRGIPAAYVVSADGGEPQYVPGTEWAWSVDFSPSGRQVVVAVPKDGGVFVVTLASGSRRLLPGTNRALHVRWSPDGRRILFERHYSPLDTRLIGHVPVRGGHAVTLVRDGNVPTWSTDGTEVNYVSDDVGSIRRVRADGTGDRVLKAGPELSVFWPASFDAPHAADTTAPPPVASVAATVDATAVHLELAGVAPDVSEYVVRRSAPGGPAPATPDDGILAGASQDTTISVTGLTEGATYRFSVFALDAWGNASPPVSVTAVPTARPRLTTPTLASDVGGDGRYAVRWGSPAGRSAPAGGYDLEHAVPAKGATGWTLGWERLLSGTTATQHAAAGRFGTVDHYRVRGRDVHGNPTAWTERTTTVPLDDDYYALRFSAGWGRGPAAGRWDSRVVYAVDAGRTVRLVTEARGFNVVAERCSGCGRFRVYVDGRLHATVDTHTAGPGREPRRNVWYVVLPGPTARHEIRIVTEGTRGRPRVILDGIGVYR